MTKVFITGDRSLTPFYPGVVALEMMRALGEGKQIITGTNGGCEMLVREFAEQSGLTVQVVEGGKPEFDARHAALAADPEVEVVVVHFEPTSSSIVRSVFEAFTDERVTLKSPADLMG